MRACVCFVHLLGTDVADVELAGEVGKLGVAVAIVSQLRREFVAEWTRVHQLLHKQENNKSIHTLILFIRSVMN